MEHTKMEAKIYAELVKLLYMQAYATIIGSLLTAGCIVYGLQGVISQDVVIHWFVALLIVCIMRLVLAKGYFYANPPIEEAPYWGTLFILTSIAGAITWMLAATILMPPFVAHQALIIFAISGIAAGSVSLFAASRVASAISLFLILPALGIKMWLLGGVNHQLIAVLSFVYLIALLFTSFRFYDQMYANIKLKYENQARKSEFDTILGAFSLINDMTPRINYLATHDSLTNLPNRIFFNADLAQGLRDAQKNFSRLALLFLDLDHFKKVNDTLGHDIGDQLLIKAVERLQQCVQQDDMIARLGGDEFVIIIKKINDVEYPRLVAKKICESMCQVFYVDDKEIYVSASVGISIYPDDGPDMQTLMRNADLAMYRAKDRGRNTFEFYTDAMNDMRERKTLMKTNFSHALEKKQLKIYYQPIISVDQNHIICMEALLRWHHPDYGYVSPHEFISIAEESDLIIPINEWVLKTACQQNSVWRHLGYPSFSVAINLSTRQFLQRRFLDNIKKILTESTLTGAQLTLELTEQVIMSDFDYSVKIIKALKELDISISLDEYGTGYLNLNRLKKIPFDSIKISRLFISDCLVNPEDAAMVKSVIAMGHHLGAKVIAVGVERPEQYMYLRDHGCDAMQGFLLCQPLSEVDIVSVLAKRITA